MTTVLREPKTADPLVNQRSAKAASSYYDHFWPALDGSLHYTERMRAEFIVEGIRRHVHRTNCEILDFGCGRGWLAPYLAAFGKVTGVDFSPVGIQIARERYGQYARFALADSSSATLGLSEDRQFDIVISTEVIEHVEDPAAYIRQVKRFLTPGGWLFLTTPNGNIWEEFVRNRRFVHSLQPIENWLRPAILSQLLRAEGFEIAVHEGRPNHEARCGKRRWLQRRLVHSLCKRFGHEARYGRWIVADALYQVVAARLPQP